VQKPASSAPRQEQSWRPGDAAGRGQPSGAAGRGQPSGAAGRGQPGAADGAPTPPGHEHWHAWHRNAPPWAPGARGRWARGPAGSGPLRRRPDEGLASGVAAGLAYRTGFDVTLVRLAIVVASLATVGFAAVAYTVAWLFMPDIGTGSSIWSQARSDRRGIALAAGLASMIFFLIFVTKLLGSALLGTVEWPLVLCTAGLVLIWRNAPASEQARMRQLAEPLLGLTTGRGRSRAWLRVTFSIVLLIAGAAILVDGHESLKMLRPLGGAVLVLAAVAILLGPWWLGIARDLVEERRARIRAEERADMAARVHDSVLQTLAMIQRRADQPQQVIQLARAQERELRSWLFDGRAPGSLDDQDMTLAAGVRRIQQEVEARHGVAVEVVIVGDCALDDDLEALLAAAREATVNAAKWSGCDVVSLFAEVEPEAVSLYVRDRGQGFDPAAVPGDRKGLAESIRARMTRRGGSAAVRSAPGEGTEVSLTMPRAAGERQPSRT
jgi:signal transduction histidine kinase